MLIADLLIELSQQETHAHLVAALEALDGLGQIGDGLFGLLSLDVVVGKGRVGQCADTLVGDLVEVDVGQHVVGLGYPSHGAIAQCLAHLAFLNQVGLPSEVAGNVSESGGGVEEVALHVLCLG